MTVRQWSQWPAYACVLTALLIFGLTGAPDRAGAPAPARALGAADALGPAAIPRPAATPKPAGTRAQAHARGAPGICTSPAHSALAATLSRRIAHALHGLSATVGIAADDPEQGIRCRYHQWWKFHSAIVIKVIILGALLYQLRGYRNLSSYEAGLAEAMITDSDNDAADELWNELGAAALQRFLTAARMNHTVLGQYDYW